MHGLHRPHRHRRACTRNGISERRAVGWATLADMHAAELVRKPVRIELLGGQRGYSIILRMEIRVHLSVDCGHGAVLVIHKRIVS